MGAKITSALSERLAGTSLKCHPFLKRINHRPIEPFYSHLPAVNLSCSDIKLIAVYLTLEIPEKNVPPSPNR
ncbi:hypothetical protein V2G26_019009 [Clonostachys chloroleuca]